MSRPNWLSAESLQGVERVLVVDDDPVVRKLLRLALRRQDRQLVVAADGDEALERLGSASYALMLLDLGLPTLSGREVLARAATLAPETDVVVITANNSVQVAVDALQLGARDFLVKPLEMAQIAQVVERVLRNRTERQKSNLARVMHAVASAETVPAIATALLEATLAACRSQEGLVALAEGGRILPRAHTGDALPVVLEELAHEVCREGVALRRMPVASGPILAVPLLERGTAVGALVLRRHFGAVDFDREDEEKLTIIASEGALARSRARLVVHLRERLRELADARLQLSAAEQLQGVGQLATAYAHELQGPIQVARSHLRAAQDAVLDEDLDEVQKRSAYAAEALDRIQDAVGDLSLLGRGRDDAEIDVARIARLARRTLGSTDGVPIEETLASCTVRGNVGHLVHAVVLLLRNAVRSVELAGSCGRVHVTTGADSSDAWIEIADEGCGITEAEATSAFEPFVSGWGQNGLGLGVAQQIVQAAGGRIALGPGPRGGAVSRLSLPLEEDSEVFELGDC